MQSNKILEKSCQEYVTNNLNYRQQALTIGIGSVYTSPSDENIWHLNNYGIICFIKDKHVKTFKIILYNPENDSRHEEELYIQLDPKYDPARRFLQFSSAGQSNGHDFEQGYQIGYYLVDDEEYKNLCNIINEKIILPRERGWIRTPSPTLSEILDGAEAGEDSSKTKTKIDHKDYQYKLDLNVSINIDTSYCSNNSRDSRDRIPSNSSSTQSNCSNTRRHSSTPLNFFQKFKTIFSKVKLRRGHFLVDLCIMGLDTVF